MVAQLQGKEHSYKQDMDQVLLQARSMVERERQEKYASLAEQKSLRQQVENLSTTMKSLQVQWGLFYQQTDTAEQGFR